MGEGFKADLKAMNQVRTQLIEPSVQQMTAVTETFRQLRSLTGAQMFVGGLGAVAIGFEAKYETAVGTLLSNQDALLASLQAFAAALQETETIYGNAEGQNTENITGAGR